MEAYNAIFRRRERNRRAPRTVTVLAVITLAGCGNTDSWVDAAPAQGWPAQYGDAANSSYTSNAGATTLALQWTRSVKGSLAAGPALSTRGWLVLNAQTPSGCSLMEWENTDNGRQRWCVRLVQGGDFAGPLFDGFDNVYVGQPGRCCRSRPRSGLAGAPRLLGCLLPQGLSTEVGCS